MIILLKAFFIHFITVMKINKSELIAKRGSTLAPNQKLPSAFEAHVSNLHISHYLLRLSDQEVAAVQMFQQNDGWGQEQWVETDAISAY